MFYEGSIGFAQFGETLVPTSPSINPARWTGVLQPLLSSEAHLRTGNAIHALIDGQATFRAMAEDIHLASGEHDYIYLLGWDIVDDFDLVPSLSRHGAGPPTSIATLFRMADARGVQIRAMLWAKPIRQNVAPVRAINALRHGAAIRDDLTANNHPVSNADVVNLFIHSGIDAASAALLAATARRNPAALGGSHHQKVLLIKRGETLIAYCGGVDINENRLNPVGASDPQHDAHCRIVGPAAWDLLQTFIKRWRHHPEGPRIDASLKGPLRGIAEPLPTAPSTPSAADAPYGGNYNTVIARTFNPVRSVPGSPAVVRERDIGQLIIAAIGNAQRFIYLEDQYLVDQGVAAALNRALPHLEHVTILIPSTPITATGFPFIGEYRRDFVQRAIASLAPSDAAKLRVFELSTSQTTPTYGHHTYVHAKTWVFDDELAVIGSANCNRRGYQHDSEVNAFIWGNTGGWNGASSFAQAYRMELWHEHLGLPLSALVDGSISAPLWRRGRRPASARVLEFDHHLPTGFAQSLRDAAAAALYPLIDPVP